MNLQRQGFLGPAIFPYDFGCIYCSLFTLFIFIFATFRLDMIAALSVASSAVLLVMVPALFGAFFWKRGAAEGVLSGVVIGGLVATILQYSGWKPLGFWPGA